MEKELAYLNAAEEVFYGWISNISKNSDDAYGRVACKIADVPITLLIDTGATVNALTEDHWKQLKNISGDGIKILNPKLGKSILTYATSDPLITVARFIADLTTASFVRPTIKAEFYVIKGAKKGLLSKHTARELGIVLMGEEVDFINSATEKEPFPIAPVPEIDFDVDPSVMPSRQCYVRIPEAFKDKVETRLQQMLNDDIIEKVDGAPEWVSSMNIVMKGPKDFRLTLNMKKANQAIRRPFHPIPTIERIRQQVGDAAWYAKLDLTQAFYHLLLSEKARNLTCFMTTKGIFRYKRLVFGVVCAPEIFQSFMERVLDGLEGALNFIDDILIFARTLEELRKRTDDVMNRLRKNK